MGKTATIPAIRVEPALREAAESVLTDHETLSGFAEEAIRAQVERRQAQADFLKRALASRDQAQQTNSYVPVQDVHSQLRKMLETAKARMK
ncbi:YlcI/YnfO family protein [Trabulsiella odontotermitis]|jgi:predicted transcriptional regulator|uniref:YlcI/YnfO family protein n=1 Tax=Trabulsiella odontotermitis TaxID=379893 RepID=UPI0006764892|nr:YlcI/YnfO family protein [Trabulsiella odontotermitis]KNC92574.1 prevent-host-death protein [Trabulsiella odontotermitis]